MFDIRWQFVNYHCFKQAVLCPCPQLQHGISINVNNCLHTLRWLQHLRRVSNRVTDLGLILRF